MQDFGTYTIKTFLPPAVPLRININRGWEYIRITNKTPLALVVDFGSGNTMQFPEMYLEDLPIPDTFTGWVTITPRIDLTNTSQSISNVVTVGAWQKGELIHPQAQPLTQQAVNITSTGKPVFSANADFSNTATAGQSLNLFNAANSGVIYYIHQALVYTNDSGFPGANLFFFVGADNNYANSVNVISHDIISTPPISTAHVTSQDSTSTPPGTVGEVIRCQQSAPNNIPIFPDDNRLFPGGNVTLNLAGTASGKIVHLTLKWTEDQVVTPALVTGATAVASVLDQESGSVGATFIKSVIPGTGTIINITDDGVGVFNVDQSGVLHQVFKFNSAGNPLQLGQAGDIVETLGQLTVDQALNALVSLITNLITNVSGNNLLIKAIAVNDQIQFLVNNVQMCHVDSLGFSMVTGRIAFAGASTLTAIKGGFTAVVTTGTDITHNLGTTPTAVTIVSGSAGSSSTFTVTAVGATTFHVVPSINCNAYWIAMAN